MSLSSTSTIKAQLATNLGSKSSTYFDTLLQFITGQLSRVEFDETVRQSLDTPHLVQLHNALIISLFDASSHHRPPTPPPDSGPKQPPRKRRRIFPYQGPDFQDDTSRSSRLKRWTLSMGKRERGRLRSLQNVPAGLDTLKLRRERDEIGRERGVVLLPERTNPPGSRLPLHLASQSRAPTLQHISDRITLISAQHDLSTPSRAVSSLMMLAFEAKLKQLIIHALTLTSSSRSISSIHPTSSSLQPSSHLTSLSFDTLFTLSPAVLPNGSAAATQQLWLPGGGGGVGGGVGDSNVPLLKDREVRDQKWQMFALLAERSSVREMLGSAR